MLSPPPLRRFGLPPLLVWLLAACSSGGSSPPSACDAIVEELASSWERCKRSTYEAAYDSFAEAFECDRLGPSGTDPQPCLEAIDALTCPMVSGGVIPQSCQGVLGEGG